MKQTWPHGLTRTEVDARVRAGRVNSSARIHSKTLPEIVVENAFSVFNIIIGGIVAFLVVCYILSGDDRLLLDAIGVSAVAILNTLIAVWQEIRAARALNKVNLLLKREVSVVRDGTLTTIPHEQIVVDDIIHMQRGDQAVVDGTVVESHHLEINESLLTGESDPVLKEVGAEVLSGSFCISGAGYYRVEKIGQESHAAQVLHQARRYKFIVTPLQRKLDLLIKGLFAMAVFLVLLSVLLRGADGFSVDFARRVVTIMVALVPQGLVLMSSVTFAIGVYRISRIGAIVQKLNAIESFANVQVICLDKTGTLTRNRLAVHRVTPLRDDLTEAVARLLLGTTAHHATDKNATARALEELGFEDGWRTMDEIPFSSDRKMSFIAIAKADGPARLFVSGAFDLLLSRCAAAERGEVMRIHEALGLGVYRNLLLAELNGGASLDDIRAGADFSMQPLCLCSITDQVRDDVADALRLFESRGVQLKILSGDSGPAIQAVCREIGWTVGPEAVLSGDVVETMPDGTLAGAVGRITIFARLTPAHKLRIIRELRRQGLYTAMIGDGVNDLPAIKEADMGIAMEEGSSITREVADIVLLKNRFTLLPHIFDEGNRIVSTVAAVAKLFLTKNVMVILLTLASLLFLLDFPLTPRRVSLINVFAIGIPAMIIAMRNRGTEPMRRFMLEVLSFVVLSSVCIVAAAWTGLEWARFTGLTQPEAEMMMVSVIITVSIWNFLAATAQRSGLHDAWKQSRRGYLVAAVCLILFYLLTTLTPDLPPFSFVRTFYEIGPTRHLDSLAIGLGFSMVLELLQTLRRGLIGRFLHPAVESNA